MIETLIILLVFATIIGVFIIRYLIGEKMFSGNAYVEQGYQVLLSRRIDAYLFDTLAMCFLSLFVFIRFDLPNMNTTATILCSLTVLTFLCARILEKCYVLYDKQGILLAKPFQGRRFVPWSEIGSIEKRRTDAEIYHVFDLTGHRLIWVPSNKKTQPFFELAERHGILVSIPKGTQMVHNTSREKLNGTLGEWDAALARSAYARNNVIGIAPFQDFAVVLFMDRHLNEDNIIALNRDGTVRWKISDIIKQSGPASYTAMTVEGADTVSVMAVLSLKYDCIIYKIDVYQHKIIRQYSRDDV